MESKKKMGRPPKPESERLVQRSIRMPQELWDKIDAHGIDWLRSIVRRAKSKR